MFLERKDKIRIIAIFSVIFIGLSYYYDLGYWLMQRPKSVHVWRQSDSASYALNYYQNDRPFFKPQVHHRHAIDGSTSSEFPIIYYLASKVYKVFGFHDYYIRWIHYGIFYSGLIALLLTSTYFIRSKILVFFPALLVMMSCVLVYYGANFLPDVPALSFALMGFYFFIRYIHHERRSDFVLSIVFSALAALLKISSGLIIGVILLYMLYHKFWQKKAIFKGLDFLTIGLGFASIFGWLYYVKIYNESGQYFGNLQGTMGIWLCTKAEINYIFQRTYEEWMPALGSRKLWILFIPATLFLLYQWKKLDEILKFFILFTFMGCIVYLISFFAVFNVHDYYFINTFIFPIILSIGIISVLENYLSRENLKVFIACSLILFAMTAEDTNAQMMNRRYHTDWNSSPAPGFFNIEPYLRSIGIDRHQLIFSPSDASTNITLYYANNPGWARLFGDMTAEQAIERGAKYMLLLKEHLDKEEFIKYKPQVVGEFEGIAVVKF